MSENLNNRIEGVSRITTWHESKIKYDEVNKQKLLQKKDNEELSKCVVELKKRRSAMLKQLYDKEALQYTYFFSSNSSF